MIVCPSILFFFSVLGKSLWQNLCVNTVITLVSEVANCNMIAGELWYWIVSVWLKRVEDTHIFVLSSGGLFSKITFNVSCVPHANVNWDKFEIG